MDGIGGKKRGLMLEQSTFFLNHQKWFTAGLETLGPLMDQIVYMSMICQTHTSVLETHALFPKHMHVDTTSGAPVPVPESLTQHASQPNHGSTNRRTRECPCCCFAHNTRARFSRIAERMHRALQSQTNAAHDAKLIS